MEGILIGICIVLTFSIMAAGAITAVKLENGVKEIKDELIKTEAIITATIGDNYEKTTYDIAGMTSEQKTFENNKILQLKTFLMKESEVINRRIIRLENIILELDRQSTDNLEQLKKGLSIEVKTEAMNTFNHCMLWERLNRLREMEKIRNGALR